jgi:hypothetical protein
MGFYSNTIIDNGWNAPVTIKTLLETHGVDYTCFLIREIYSKYSCDQLIELGFSPSVFGKVWRRLRRGFSINDVSKKTGKLKVKNVKFSLKDDLTKLNVTRCQISEFMIRRCKRIILKKYLFQKSCIDAFVKQSIKFPKDDPITCEPINVPCFILKDWKIGCKHIYDFSTIQKLKKPPEIVISTFSESLSIIGLKPTMYVSPFTRLEFYPSSIKLLHEY